jgi:hypothetical protein
MIPAGVKNRYRSLNPARILPAQNLAGCQRHKRVALVTKTVGNRVVLPNKLNITSIARQAIEVRSKMTDKGFELIEGLRLVKDLGIKLQCKSGGETACTSAVGLF